MLKKGCRKVFVYQRNFPVNPKLRSIAQKLKRYLSTMEVVAICKNDVIYGADETKKIRSDRDLRTEIPRRAGPVRGISITSSEAKFLFAT